MVNVIGKSTGDRLREAIEQLVAQCEASVPRALTEALLGFLRARDYSDITVMRSHLNAALESLQSVTNEAVEKRLGWPTHVREVCRNIRDEMTGCVSENWDDLGKLLESRFDGALRILMELRDGPVKALQEHGYEVRSALRLEGDIRELEELKEEVLFDWPWSDRELPPVNRAMVAASRAALDRGERGERIEDLIRRLVGNPAKSDH
jgi:hypothetical protein